MKIVILEKEEGLNFGGVAVHNKRLLEYLKSKNHEVIIIRFTNKKSVSKGTYNIPYYIAEKRTFIFVPSEKTDNLLRKYLEKIKPDAVHFCLGISPFDLFIPSLCHELKIPVVGIWHQDITHGNSPYSLLSKSVFLAYLPIIKQLDSLIVFTNRLKIFYTRHGVNPHKMRIIPNGVDATVFSPGLSEFKEKYNIKTGILFLGRLTLVKNPEILIKSFLELNAGPETKLVLAGSGDLEHNLKTLFQDKRVIFTGMIKDEQVKVDIIRACNVFILPSGFEGMSLALLESMSTGLACIATDVGAHPELMKNAGIVLPHNNLSHSLPMALNMLLENPWLTTEFGKRARKKILKLYSNDTIMPKYVELYQETISDFQKNSYKKTRPLNLASPIIKRLEKFWKQAKKLSSGYLFDI